MTWFVSLLINWLCLLVALLMLSRQFNNPFHKSVKKKWIPLPSFLIVSRLMAHQGSVLWPETVAVSLVPAYLYWSHTVSICACHLPVLLDCAERKIILMFYFTDANSLTNILSHINKEQKWWRGASEMQFLCHVIKKLSSCDCGSSLV